MKDEKEPFVKEKTKETFAMDGSAMKTLVELTTTCRAGKLGDDGEPFCFVPDGTEVVSLKEYVPPLFIDRRVSLQDAESFCAYVNHFRTEDTLVFCSLSECGCSFTAILDYHGAAPGLKPQRCQHIAVYTAIDTPEWIAIEAANGAAMSQVEFAIWLEDKEKLFVEPKGAELLELVRTLHGHRNARFTTALRLDNGSYSVSYDEDIVIKGTETTRSESFDLPPLIKFGAAVFLGGEKFEIAARLKSRCEDRSLILVYQITGHHEIIRQSVLALVKQVADRTNIIPLLGNP